MPQFLLNVPNDLTEEVRDEFYGKMHFNRKSMMEEHGPKTKYVNLQFRLSTSNVVESLFSLARVILTHQHKSMSPIVFEAMLNFHKNREYWSVIDVAQAMRNTPSEKKPFNCPLLLTIYCNIAIIYCNKFQIRIFF
jgi:hypothetical protein